MYFRTILFSSCFLLASGSIALEAQQSTDAANLAAMQRNLELVENLRQDFISRPEAIVRALPRQGETFSGSVMSHLSEVRRIIHGSIPFMGCVGHRRPVVGFFNTAHNIWLIAWLDDRNRVEAARIGMGFVLAGERIKNSWFDTWTDGSADSISSAMQGAFSYQLRAFPLMFPYENCPEPNDVDYLFQDNNALTSIIYSSVQFSAAPRSAVEQIVQRNNIEYASATEGASLDPVFLHPSILDVDIFLVLASSKRPDVYIVQAWNNNNSEYLLVFEEVFNLTVN